MDEQDLELLAEAARVVDEAAQVEALATMARVHARLGMLMDALEARMEALAAGDGTAS